MGLPSCASTEQVLQLALAAAENSERRMRIAQQAAHAGTWEWDLQSGTVIRSREVEELYGCAPGTSKPTLDWWRAHLSEDDVKRSEKQVEQMIAGQSEYHAEYQITRDDGVRRWIEAFGRVFFDEQGKPARVVGVDRDITDRKRMEEALSASEARYRELAQNLDRQIQARTIELEERNNQMLRASEGLRELSGRVLRVQDEERRRIARELHDSAGQILTALGLELGSLAQDLHEAAPQLESNLAGALELVQQLHREIRTTSYLLHPPLLDEAGLHCALSWYLEGLRQRSGLDIHLHIPEGFGRLSRDMELVIFRLIQESVTNIHRHSGSASAEIRMVRESGAVTIEVQDHGKGMSEEELKRIREGGSGVGIRGMRERLRQFRGELRIESDRLGTRVLVRMPIPPATMELASESLQSAI